MSQGVAAFVGQLRVLGYEPSTPLPDFATFVWQVEVGPLAGTEIELGFRVPTDFSLSTPGGILVRPHVMPLTANGETDHPYGGVHPASVGGIEDTTWQYWSRPHPDWAGTDRTVAALMAHVRHLFDTLPADLALPHAA